MRIWLLTLVLFTLLLVFTIGLDSGRRAQANSQSFSARLAVTVWPQGKQGPSRHYTLVCPARAQAQLRSCAALKRLGWRAFAPTPVGIACTQIYGGPQRARISGVVAGHRLYATLGLADGCQIARWQKVRAIVPIPKA